MLLQVSGSQLVAILCVCVCVFGEGGGVIVCKCASMEEAAMGMREMS